MKCGILIEWSMIRPNNLNEILQELRKVILKLFWGLRLISFQDDSDSNRDV